MRTRTIGVGFLGLALLLAAAAQNVTVKKGPVSYTSAASGQEMYVSYCASCHGTDGKGHGPAATALNTLPTDLTSLKKRHGGKFPADYVHGVLLGKTELAAHGSADMPVWGPIFRQLGKGSTGEMQLRVANVSSYIESMQGK